MSEIKLKPCPFCGGEAYKRITFPPDPDGMEVNMYVVGCNECDFEFYTMWDEEAAIEAWNTRKPIDDIKRRLKAHAADYKDKSNAYEQGKAFAYENSARIIDFMLRGE